ncbi:hypothetical protein QYF36_019069 [Acer negundo]|nr:hypothetical protein QYF36_019069 [Acer negundo]
MMSKESKDLLDSLLNLAEENSSELSLAVIKHLFLDLFVAGIDTTSSTIEWAMAELLHNPEKLTKAQTELRQRMVYLMLASLLCTFDWKLANDMKPEDMDMTEKFGLTLHKSEPLLAVPIKV